jgi:hypothetical protein
VDLSKVSFQRYYLDAAPITRIEGTNWYPAALRICKAYARKYKRPLKQVVALLAVLSQRQTWQRNIELLENTLESKHPNTLLSVAEKCYKLLAGQAPETVIKGPKITAFYHAIRGNEESVVIDSWMLKAIGRKSVTQKQYNQVAQILRQEAESVGVPATTYQAIVWCQIRGKAE